MHHSITGYGPGHGRRHLRLHMMESVATAYSGVIITALVHGRADEIPFSLFVTSRAGLDSLNTEAERGAE